MYATWDFLKRHRAKIAAGAAVAGVLVSTKMVVESDLMKECIEGVKATLFGAENTENSFEPDDIVQQHQSEARRQFIFDMHQQSCDKTLHEMVNDLRAKLSSRFDTDNLLEMLKSPELTSQQKIELWEKLKVLSLSKLVSVMVVFPLAILVSKAQKSILCQQFYQTTPKSVQPKNSMFNDGLLFMKSMFYSDDSAATTSQFGGADNSTKELFGHLLDYFRNDGINLLLGVIEKVTQQILDDVKLTQRFNTNDLLFLFERIRAKMSAICGENNYTDFIIPTLEINLANLSSSGNGQFGILLRHFENILKTQKCRQLMELFGSNYLDAVIQFLDSSIPSGTSLPLAKIVPIFCNAFATVAVNTHSSTFHSIIHSPELHEFTLLVSECSKPGDLLKNNNSL